MAKNAKEETCAVHVYDPPYNQSLKQAVVDLLDKRGVPLDAIAQLVHGLQRPYDSTLTLERCLDSVDHVLDKREVQYAALTGIALDMQAERNDLPEPLLTIVKTDDSLYGIDEVLALSICNVYGSVGLTSFGYLDKMKSGILERLNFKGTGIVNTFLDDIVAGIAAAAGARIAHHGREEAAATKALEA